jgi:hypothetical protein
MQSKSGHHSADFTHSGVFAELRLYFLSRDNSHGYALPVFDLSDNDAIWRRSWTRGFWVVVGCQNYQSHRGCLHLHERRRSPALKIVES